MLGLRRLSPSWTCFCVAHKSANPILATLQFGAGKSPAYAVGKRTVLASILRDGRGGRSDTVPSETSAHSPLAKGTGF